MRDHQVGSTDKVDLWNRVFPLRRMLPNGYAIKHSHSCFMGEYMLNFYTVKMKYKNMSNNITFRKIINKDGEVIGALNINNMIPVREEYLVPFDM